MARRKIGNDELRKLGITTHEGLKHFGKAAKKLWQKKHLGGTEIIELFRQLIADPERITPYVELERLKNVLRQQSHKTDIEPSVQEQNLREVPLNYTIYGEENIEAEALKQMEVAMRLPIAAAGALMPDAHSGYGLPIGGVLATDKNVVIPYAVGVDIACRMCLTIFDLPGSRLDGMKDMLGSVLIHNTVFGVGSKCKDHLDDSLFDDANWKATRIIRDYQDLAYSQLGTSGAGNHFVEWGILETLQPDPFLDIPEGMYLALLSHSGSRGFGNEIATHYSKLAMQKNPLPREALHLAWLNLEKEEGEEYWIAMNLAGKYASANHREIHGKIVRETGFSVIGRIENHHNFAWKEKLPNGREVIVHRKGATPASSDAIGIIPGSMTLPGFIVRGKGSPDSLNSASHGAGRLMSRNQAFHQFSMQDVLKEIKKYGVELIGGDVDEAPMVYKNINEVMSQQSSLVEILARFSPKIVRMADPERRSRNR